jgi:hypothetical protein
MDPVTGAAVIAAVASIVSALLQRNSNKKISETHKQTTQNGHKHDPPTIPDQLSTLTSEVRHLHVRMDNHEEWHRNN